MPQPSSAQVHVNKPLTNMSVAWMQSQSRFVAPRMFGTVPVEKQSDLYFTYGRDTFFRDEARLRAPSTPSAGGGYDTSTDSYNCKVYAFHKDVDGQTRSNTDNPLDADRDATQFVSQKMLIKRERLFLDSFFKSGIWTGSTSGTDITPGTKWSAANSTPIEDIDAQIWQMATTGYFPNKLLLGATTWQGLKNHAELLDRIKYTQKGVLTTELLASLIAPPETPDFEVLVAAAVEDTSKEGQATDMNFMASPKDALLVYSEPNPGLQKVSAGYIFTWTGYLGAGAFGNAIYNFPLPELGVRGGVTERIEGEIAFDANQVAPDLGVYFSAAVA